MTSDAEIGVWVDGVQKWVTGVTRRTTCHDVIKALLRAQSVRAEDSDVMQYVIVERWRKVERPLDHEQRILKVWRTWGEAVGEVRFSLRKMRDGEAACGAGSSGRAERSRRRHRMRSVHGSKEALNPKKLAKDDPKFSETMERLMRLVVAQGETIQTQLRRLQERECQIEQYEQQMHLLRVQNLGRDYLLHSYLKDDSCEAKDDPGSEEKSNDSGVVTEEAAHALEGMTPEEEAATSSELEELQQIAAQLSRIEDLNNRLLHEEETMSGMSTAVQAAHEQHKDEAELLQQELVCVAHVHAQLVADVRQNEQRLRDSEAMLWQQRKQLELLLQEEDESDRETQALREHLEYIIHLPPTAFRLPADAPVPQAHAPPSAATDATTAATSAPRVPPVNSAIAPVAAAPSSTKLSNKTSKNSPSSEDKDAPPPLPACPPPIDEEEEDEDDGDSAKNSSLCVSSRSSTSSEASTSSNTSGFGSKTPSTSAPKSSSSSSSTSLPSSSLPSSTKASEGGGKDTDSTDSNSDTGLSSLHSSSDEGVYVLDTLV
ncbi:ras association domain-containing protein 10-like isoform X2 [Penaeus japonicus]|nr:ras association domain-containing protein 10-like isoform X2 [Penaeus japonicus]XP_042872336.1 ras association domain-containing protein 10-like isoform X2 [Penaeus japonicus]